jgi:hypothetical protein
MDTRVHHNTIFASSRSAQQNNVEQNNSSVKSNRPNLQNPRDLIVVSDGIKTVKAGTHLISETIEELQNGYRKTQKFEQADGRQFTKIEEFSVSDKQSRRTVTQQNASGSTSRLEDIFDRQEDGSFRLTQRFTNEIGETSVNIDPNATPPSTDFILGRTPSTNTPPINPERGSEFNIVI